MALRYTSGGGGSGGSSGGGSGGGGSGGGGSVGGGTAYNDRKAREGERDIRLEGEEGRKVGCKNVS